MLVHFLDMIVVALVDLGGFVSLELCHQYRYLLSAPQSFLSFVSL
jgi:hypothetical protein